MKCGPLSALMGEMWESRARDGMLGPGSVTPQSLGVGEEVRGARVNDESYPVSLLGSVYYPRWLLIYCLGGGKNFPFLRTMSVPSLVTWSYYLGLHIPSKCPCSYQTTPFLGIRVCSTSYLGGPVFQWPLACLLALHTANISIECVCAQVQ